MVKASADTHPTLLLVPFAIDGILASLEARASLWGLMGQLRARTDSLRFINDLSKWRDLMTRGVCLALLLALSASFMAQSPAAGQVPAFSLDLYHNPAGGGTWRVVGKTPAGFAGMQLGNTETAAIVLPAELGSGSVFGFGLGHSIVITINRTPPIPYGVGVIGGPIPSSYVDPPGLQISTGWQFAGSFTGGVVLAEGTYLSGGPSPSWSSVSGGASAETFVNTTSADISSTRALKQLRFVVIPEPATAILAGFALVGMLAASRRSSGRLRS
jgi:hypothetical protein